MLKKATAVSSDRNEPTTRPCTPRWALELTALFVPLTGPNTAIGASTSAPRTRPTTVAAAPCQNESPNRIGNAPSTLVAKVLAPPKQTRNRSSGRALRSASGICSTPYVSTSVIDDDAGPAGGRRGGGLLLAHDPAFPVSGEGVTDRCSCTTRTTSSSPRATTTVSRSSSRCSPSGVRMVVRTRCVTTAAVPSSCTCRSLLSHPTTRQPPVTQESHRARYAARPAMTSGSLWNRNVASGARQREVRRGVGAGEGLDEGVERRQGVGLVERWQGAVGHAGVSSVGWVDARGAVGGRAIDRDVQESGMIWTWRPRLLRDPDRRAAARRPRTCTWSTPPPASATTA